MEWLALALFSILVLPFILEFIPTLVDWAINFVLWFIWILKYRDKS